MSCGLSISNQQSERLVEWRFLEQLISYTLREELGCEEFDISICLVDTNEIIRLNETYLQHEGATDVITFDYGEELQPGLLTGEICISVPEAVVQARLFKTTWQSEVVRYVIHGLLHLRGYDDQTASARRKMKREENRLLGGIRRAFPLEKLSKRGRQESRSKANRKRK